MIERKKLKNGDEVSAIYIEGYATEGMVVPMIVKKVGKDYVIAIRKNDNTEFKFAGDELLYEGVRYSCSQRFNLFLGTAEEAEKYNEERCRREELYSNNQELLLHTLPRMSVVDLEKVIEIAKKYI